MSKTTVEIDSDLESLIPQFLENRKKDIETLQQLVDSNNLSEISQLAHKIKGAASSYGFNELSELASQMEVLAKQNSDIAPLKELVKKMRVHFLSIEIHYVSI